MDILSKFSERLQELFSFRDGLTSKELGAAIGVHSTAVNVWLRGESAVTLDNAIKLADFFGCSLDYLAGTSEKYEEVTPRDELPPFYPRLRELMVEKGVSRFYFHTKTDIKDSYFTRWAKGSVPDLINVVKVAKELDVSLDYLVGRTDY